jgi:hypothetical protein
MRRYLVLFVLSLAMFCCTDDAHKNLMSEEPVCESDTTTYPQKTADGSQVYILGKMTADKGLKLYPDTVPTLATNSQHEELLRKMLEKK